ncbi:MAG: RidA family protein [Deltaproteobacteria bacterium]|nr:RidA family protein [Deltaproteobacteria bacterium]
MARIETVQPEGWPRPSGYANGVIASGRVLYVAGQIGWDATGAFVGDDMLAQFRQALSNVLAVVRAAGGEASDVVRLTAYLVDLDAYRRELRGFGVAYREIMGKHFPAMAFVGVAGLVEPRALVEIEATAVLAEEP